MTQPSRRVLFWTPRILSIAFIIFLSLFALDVFNDAHGFWNTIAALLIHLIPAFVLTAGLILAWRWEWVGAVFYAAAGAGYVVTVLPLRISPSAKLSWILTIAAPAFVLAAMFLANWLKRAELHPR
jgi:hypothetical protein